MKSTVTAPNNDVSYSYTNGAGQTSKTERVEPGTNEPVVIEYAFDPIGQLLTVTDAGNNVTSYAYDLAGRRLSVNHPSAGLTSFVYDNAGNVLRRGTANGDTVTYQYEYNRLVKTEYPRHPENNVTYTYGGRNAKHNRVGRLALVEDGSGATEYYYGKMGEVTKQRRTLIIPNVAVATYTTEWQYDSHNRLQEMIYPDGEKIKYFYNLGGQLSSIVGEKKYLYRYIDTIGYDMYEQRKYMKYGNGVKTNYAYSPNRRRLESLTVASKGVNIMDNTYTYDVMDNIVRLVNNGVTQVGKDGKTIGGYTSHSYSYDKWNRLTNAMG
ncbi:MAG: RHS repeat domain-containing protein, partial [Bacteroidales bacterium]|nr:RHS repeat domain-containing protein [Bacteroidales bacterium]